MLWLILFFIGVLLLIIGFLCENQKAVWRIRFPYDLHEGCYIFGWVFAVLAAVISVIVFIVGISVYPGLISQQEEIKSLQARIVDVRAARYDDKIAGTLVGGSLDNMSQSQTLSQYIRMVAEKEAGYNSNLANAKIQKEQFILKFSGYGIFVSNKIYELKRF